jgi:hypothetical protein
MKHLVTGKSKSKRFKEAKNLLAEYDDTTTFFNNNVYI